MPLFKKTLPDWMRARLSASHRFLILCILCGILCGMVAVAFHLGIRFVFEGIYYRAQSFGSPYFAWVMITAPAFAGLVVGLAIHGIAPSAAGGGIARIREAYFNKDGHIPFLAGVWRFLLSLLYLGFGNSLGREGPVVHISSAISSTLGRWGFRDRKRARSMLPVGVGAGLAAAFNAPLSAITFVFEQLLDSFSIRALGGIVLAVVAAAALSRSLLGDQPILPGHLVVDYPLSPWMLVAIPLGIAAGVLGHLIVSSILLLRRLLKTNRRFLPLWSQPAIAGLLCGLLGVAAIGIANAVQPEAPDRAKAAIFSVGYEVLPSAFNYQLLWQILAVLLLFKVVAVVFSFAAGGSGGLFSPSLFIGGTLGGLIGAILVWVDADLFNLFDDPEPAHVVGGCVLLGMGAAFASIIRCPFTSLTIIIEITGNYSLILPLIAANTLSWTIARRLRPLTIFNSILLQDGVILKRMPAYRGPQDHHSLPVSTIMTHEVVTLGNETTGREALARLKNLGTSFHTYPVVTAEGRLVGLLTRDDLRGSMPDADIGSLVVGQQLVVAHPDTSIRDVGNRLVARSLHLVPIVSARDQGKLIGVVTLGDIARQNFAEEVD